MSLLGRRRLTLLALLLALAPYPSYAARPADPAPIPAGLAERHRAFLEEAAPLLSPKERETFLGLKEEYQRDVFIRRFWEVRDPFPQTPRNEFQERWQERVALARQRYGDLADDRARLLLLNGKPDQVLQSHCSDVLLPLELWHYDRTEHIRGGFSLVFFSPLGAPRGRYRLWYPTEGVEALLATGVRAGSARVTPEFLAASCPRGDDIAGFLAEAIDWSRIEASVHVVPRPSEEWLQTFVSFSTDLPAGAATFPAELALSFPGRLGSRTVVQGVVAVPRDAVRAARLADLESYDFVVDGEVVHKDELFEHFRYRFTLPVAEAAGQMRDGKIPLVFQRTLRPGSYTLRLKVEDAGGKRFFRDERPLEVPAVALASNAVTAAGAAGPAVAAVAAATQPPPAPGPPRAADPAVEANAALGSGDHTVRLVAPGDEELLRTGKARVEALVTGDGIARVSFLLNGRPVLSKSHPPYSVELNLGDKPKTHTVKAVALGPGGEELARGELLLNAGPHRFALRLVEPQAGRLYRDSLRAEADVQVPEGDELDHVDFFLNDVRLASLYQPPFAQPILLPRSQQGVAYVRAVAYLKDGNSTEDVVLVNSPEYGEKVQVDLVELYTTVVDRRGRPVAGLKREDFQVAEDGVPQRIRRFDMVKDQPIYAGILLDTSASMSERLDEAVRAALGFFEKVITPKDRAAVITFNGKPSLAVRFTNNREVLAGGVANLTAEGTTALYDSIIYALYTFGGIKGKRAIILLTDGMDEGSHYKFTDALDYARRAGVTLYTVGIHLEPNETDVRAKLQRLAEETGGRFFFVERASELAKVYAAVEADLRTQYLVAYESTQPGGDRDKFRAVEVKLARPGLEAKTMRGYYP
jgi:Ca-activated chloride channel family protein